jgi:hypothetical protein
VNTFRTRLPRSHPTRPSRECLLFRAYRSARGRAHGNCTKAPWTYARGWPWACYAEFRAWALRSGFSKATPSPDRIDPTLPYGPDNVRWVSALDNNGTSRGRKYYAGDDAVRGPEPPVDDHVPF